MKYTFRVEKTVTLVDVGYITIESDNQDDAEMEAQNSYDVDWEDHDPRLDVIDKEIELEESK